MVVVRKLTDKGVHALKKVIKKRFESAKPDVFLLGIYGGAVCMYDASDWCGNGSILDDVVTWFYQPPYHVKL